MTPSLVRGLDKALRFSAGAGAYLHAGNGFTSVCLGRDLSSLSVMLVVGGVPWDGFGGLILLYGYQDWCPFWVNGDCGEVIREWKTPRRLLIFELLHFVAGILTSRN